jgi:hypothetical protein
LPPILAYKGPTYFIFPQPSIIKFKSRKVGEYNLVSRSPANIISPAPTAVLSLVLAVDKLQVHGSVERGDWVFNFAQPGDRKVYVDHWKYPLICPIRFAATGGQTALPRKCIARRLFSGSL